METKKCKKCGKEKSIDSFSTYKIGDKTYIKSYCKTCCNKHKSEKRKANPGKEFIREKNKALKRKYGITLEDYNNMYNDQQGLCKICGTYHDTLCVDHCHDSNVVRGLLCTSCNTMLGFAKDNSSILGKAILYLKQTRTDKN